MFVTDGKGSEITPTERVWDHLMGATIPVKSWKKAHDELDHTKKLVCLSSSCSLSEDLSEDFIEISGEINECQCSVGPGWAGDSQKSSGRFSRSKFRCANSRRRVGRSKRLARLNLTTVFLAVLNEQRTHRSCHIPIFNSKPTRTRR